MANVTIDPWLEARNVRVQRWDFSTARVATRETPPALLEEMKVRETEILHLPEPRVLLESSKILATRAGYKALGKDPARYRGSAEALLRRIISGKGFPQINSVVDIINLISVESRLPIGLYDLAHVKGDIVFRPGRAGETYKGIGKYDLNLEGLAGVCRCRRPARQPDERFRTHHGHPNHAAISPRFSFPLAAPKDWNLLASAWQSCCKSMRKVRTSSFRCAGNRQISRVLGLDASFGASE